MLHQQRVQCFTSSVNWYMQHKYMHNVWVHLVKAYLMIDFWMNAHGSFGWVLMWCMQASSLGATSLVFPRGARQLCICRYIEIYLMCSSEQQATRHQPGPKQTIGVYLTCGCLCLLCNNNIIAITFANKWWWSQIDDHNLIHTCADEWLNGHHNFMNMVMLNNASTSCGNMWCTHRWSSTTGGNSLIAIRRWPPSLATKPSPSSSMQAHLWGCCRPSSAFQ